MKSDGPLKHFALALFLAVACYALFYPTIEHRRTRKGPWEVTFTSLTESNASIPVVIINEPKLAITNVQILFLEEKLPPTQLPIKLVFSEAKAVPFEVPFGKCIFMDTTFLPGTLTLRLFNHEVELLPRVLITDQREHPWLSNNSITVHPLQAPANLPAVAR
ncbi:MAG TPA: hypothetical protein VL361_13720 [Candidatus Limnocylindrales bacterium]|nr:hypothetical protein [Candidatus Limnocylindrales bacterium]